MTMIPPPTKLPSGPRAPPTRLPPNTNTSANPGDNGKTPVAYRTRSRNPPPNNNGNKKITTAVGAPKPPIPSRPAINNSTFSAANIANTTTGSSAMDPSSLNVDDAIAKRRAELRRLQQKMGGGVGMAGRPATGGLATARSRLGHKGGDSSARSMKPPLGGRRGAVAATAALVNSTPDLGGGAKVSTTPSTATVARRLDASYGTPAAASAPPAKPQPPIATNPSLSRLKRSSEIFAPGKQQQAANATAAKAAPVPPQAAMRTGLASLKHNSQISSAGKQQTQALNTGGKHYPTIPDGQSSPNPSPMNDADNKNLTKSPPKSPFGHARATATPIVLNLGKMMPMAPPLAMEPPHEASVMGNVTGMPKRSVDSQTRLIQPMTVNQQLQLKVPHNAPSAKAPAVKQQQQSMAKSAEEIDSGKSTPIMSNLHESTNGDAAAEVAKKGIVMSQSAPSKKKEDSKVKTSSSMGVKTDEKAHTPSSSNMSRLMNDLQRTEKEKMEALKQVNELKALLEQGKQKEKSNQPVHQQQPLSVNSNSGLSHQFKEMVSTQGESAAVAWISKHLEGISKDNDGYSPLSPSSTRCHRGRDSEETDLLSSVLPPLTPRSRPGSRAASPERGGGGGLLLSQSLGQELDKAAGRGKRMTTPMPKHLSRSDNKEGMEREGLVGSTRETVEREYLVAAAKSIPNEYGTQLASYLVRRPYVNLEERNSDGNNNIIWESMESYTHLTDKQEYLDGATALDPDSIEILAYIEADGSVFTLTGKSDARHGKLPNISLGSGSGSFEGENETKTEDSFDWAVFDDVEKMNRALGRVTYIDVEGNEREYWLDSIYEEALTTRESYCMSMISAAVALKEVTGGRGVTTKVVPTQQIPSASPMGQPVRKANNASVPVEPMQQLPMNAGNSGYMHPPLTQPSSASSTRFPPQPAGNIPSLSSTQPGLPTPDEPTLNPSQPTPHHLPSKPKSEIAPAKIELPPAKEKQSQPSTTRDQKQRATSKDKPTPEEEYESADSALPLMVISLFSLLFSMIWFFVKIPIRIGSTLFAFWILVIALRILWLFLADDNGAWEMGAGAEYEYNMPSIY